MRLIENESDKFTSNLIKNLNEGFEDDISEKEIAEEIFENFEDITGVSKAQMYNDDGTLNMDMIEQTSADIITYVDDKYGFDVTRQYDDVLYILGDLFNTHVSEYVEECSLKENDTEDYWDAKEIIRDGFLALLKFNFGTDFKGNNYIITNDAYDMKRFYAKDDEEAKKIYNEYKSKKESAEGCDLKEADGDSTFKLALNLNNEAFGDGDNDDDVFSEISRILKDVAGNLEYTDKKAILDINGNTVGYYGFGYEGVVDSLDESVVKANNKIITSK